MILGSKSSKCTEIKTPVDPHKIRFIDNKRISIIIGCVAGILVFIFIIISIVMNREDKEEEAENENESLSGSAATAHKSPGKWFYKTFCFAFIHFLSFPQKNLSPEKSETNYVSVYCSIFEW